MNKIDTISNLSLSLRDQIVQTKELANSIYTLSQNIEGTTLKIIIGCLVMLLGSDYIKPITSKAKLIYLLFIPSWISFGLSLYYSNLISRINASIVRFTNLDDIKSIIYDENGLSDLYSKQSDYFYFGILVLAVWLFSYLIWWIFSKQLQNNKGMKNLIILICVVFTQDIFSQCKQTDCTIPFPKKCKDYCKKHFFSNGTKQELISLGFEENAALEFIKVKDKTDSVSLKYAELIYNLEVNFIENKHLRKDRDDDRYKTSGSPKTNGTELRPTKKIVIEEEK